MGILRRFRVHSDCILYVSLTERVVIDVSNFLFGFNFSRSFVVVVVHAFHFVFRSGPHVC